MNHLVLSEKGISRNQFLESNGKSGLYLLDSTVNINNVGDALAFVENISMQYKHTIEVQCQNHFLSLKQFMRYTILNEKLSHTVNGPTNYPLVRFKDSEGLNIWENFESQNKYGGKWAISYPSFNVDNGFMIMINDFKVIDGGSIITDEIYLRIQNVIATNIDISIRFSKTELKVINNYDNSQIGTTINHDFTQEHCFLIAIKNDGGNLKMGLHFFGKDETVFTTGFFATGIFISSGGNNNITFGNGYQTTKNQTSSLSGLDFFAGTGLNFVTSIPASNSLNKIYNHFTLHDSIIDTKIASNYESTYNTFFNSVYTKKYDDNKLIICYVLVRNNIGDSNHKFIFMIYDKITNSFINKKEFSYPPRIENTVATYLTSAYRGAVDDIPINIIVVGSNILIWYNYSNISNNNMNCWNVGIYSSDLGVTWKRMSDSTVTTTFADAIYDCFESYLTMQTTMIIANDNQSMLNASVYLLSNPYIECMYFDGTNIWTTGVRNVTSTDITITKSDLNGNTLGTWQHYQYKPCRNKMIVVGSYLYLFDNNTGDNVVVKLDVNNPMNIIKRETFNNLSIGYFVKNSVTTDGTYFYIGTSLGYILKIDMNLNVIGSYLVTLPTSKSIMNLIYYSTTNTLYFITPTAAKLYRISTTFTGETSYTLTGYLGTGSGVGLAFDTSGTYLFINEPNATAGKIIRFTIATSAVTSSALSVNTISNRASVYVDTINNWVICDTGSGINRFVYPTLLSRQAYEIGSAVGFHNCYVQSNTRLYLGSYDIRTSLHVLTNYNMKRINISALPLSIETNYIINEQYKICVKSHKDYKNLKNYDKLYYFYNSGIPAENPAAIEYGTFVGSINLKYPYAGETAIDNNIGGVCFFRIPSSSDFAMIYHGYDTVLSQWHIYAQRINFSAGVFTFSGSPVIIISNVGSLASGGYNSLHAVVDTDSNIYYIFISSARIGDSSPGFNLKCAYNTGTNLFLGWTLTGTLNGPLLLVGGGYDPYVYLKSIEYFNNDLIRLYCFPDPSGYNAFTQKYNFILLQSNIKYKKPSNYLSNIWTGSYMFSLASWGYYGGISGSGDNQFVYFNSYSPKLVFDSNSINKVIDNIFSILVDGINIKFAGSLMYDSDTIYVSSDYQIKGDEIVSISPSELWKSVDDLSMIRITFDATLEGNSNLKFIFNTFGLINTNFRTAKILACNDGDFDTPDFSQTIYSNYVYKDNGANIYSDTISAIDENYIKLTNLNSSKLNLFSLIGKFIETTGTIKKVYKIINCDKYGIYTSGNPDSDGVLVSDLVYLFDNRFLNVTSNFGLETGIQKYRYIGIEIPIQPTYDGYFQIGKFLIGLGLKLTYARSVPYTDSLSSGVQINKSIGMQSYPVINHKALFETEIAWNKLRKDGKEELESFLRYIELNKYNFIFCNNPDSIVKDDNTLNNFQLVRLDGDYELSHELGDDSIFVVSLNLVEEL